MVNRMVALAASGGGTLGSQLARRLLRRSSQHTAGRGRWQPATLRRLLRAQPLAVPSLTLALRAPEPGYADAAPPVWRAISPPLWAPVLDSEGAGPEPVAEPPPLTASRPALAPLRQPEEAVRGVQRTAGVPAVPGALGLPLGPRGAPAEPAGRPAATGPAEQAGEVPTLAHASFLAGERPPSATQPHSDRPAAPRRPPLIAAARRLVLRAQARLMGNAPPAPLAPGESQAVGPSPASAEPAGAVTPVRPEPAPGAEPVARPGGPQAAPGVRPELPAAGQLQRTGAGRVQAKLPQPFPAEVATPGRVEAEATPQGRPAAVAAPPVGRGLPTPRLPAPAPLRPSAPRTARLAAPVQRTRALQALVGRAARSEEESGREQAPAGAQGVRAAADQLAGHAPPAPAAPAPAPEAEPLPAPHAATEPVPPETAGPAATVQRAPAPGAARPLPPLPLARPLAPRRAEPESFTPLAAAIAPPSAAPVQRTAEEPAPAASPPSAQGPGEGAQAAPGVDVDELARRVYEILRRRLRVERERSYGRGS